MRSVVSDVAWSISTPTGPRFELQTTTGRAELSVAEAEALGRELAVFLRSVAAVGGVLR